MTKYDVFKYFTEYNNQPAIIDDIYLIDESVHLRYINSALSTERLGFDKIVSIDTELERIIYGVTL